MSEALPDEEREEPRCLPSAELDKLSVMINHLSDHGIRITKQRKQALSFFLEAPGFVSAMDIYFELAKMHPGLSYNTVYRNIRLFSEFGLIEHFVYDGGVRFKLSCIDVKEEHYHLICIRCEKTVPVDYEPTKLTAGMPEHFKPLKYKFDVYGYCSECKD